MRHFKVPLALLCCALGTQGLAASNAATAQRAAEPLQAKAPPATSPVKPRQPSIPPIATADQVIPKVLVEFGDAAVAGPTQQGQPRPNSYWWPNLIDVSALRHHVKGGNPLGDDFNYPKAFATLDMAKVKADMHALLHESKDWWPADYGNYGPFFIRMAWHSAGTYRALDGRGGADGGQQRFEPLNSWPDNANLDKARRLIQPLVDKYYPNLSWADAIVLAGNVALEDMGFKTLGFAGGRVDDWEPDLVYWGPEDKFLESKRFDEKGQLLLPLAASVMGLIYVNPEGPDGVPDPLKSATRIRTTFGRMGMNDEETVALIAGGHTFGKAHGAHSADKCLGHDPAGAGPEAQGTGWHNKCGQGHGPDTVTSGIEGSWSPRPVEWTHEYLTNLYKYNWSLQKGPGGKYQWYAKELEEKDRAPDASNPGAKVAIMMMTTDLALRFDPAYDKIARRYLANPEDFSQAFAKAWFKLIHRDLGPKSRYLGKDYPTEDFIWQDPVPAADYAQVDAADIAQLKKQILASGLSVSALVKTAWASAVTYRGTDMKGGANGARLRLKPQSEWTVNEPAKLASNLQVLEGIQQGFNDAAKKSSSRKQISLADLIVLGGAAGVEEAARRAGQTVEVPFTPGRTDASQEQTDVAAFQNLKVTGDGFRNYYDPDANYLPPAKAFIDRADLLTLTVPEMTVLTGGLRVLGANYNGSQHGVFTAHPETLTNDFFVNLLDQSLQWKASPEEEGVFIGRDRSTGQQKWTATTNDLIFGSSSELRVASFTYASKFAQKKFVYDFVKAWDKVMMLDRFDLASR